MKARKIIITVAAGGIFLLCLAGLWFAYDAYTKSSKGKTTLAGTFSTLQQMYGENPFPSTNNVCLLRSDAAWLTSWRQSLVEEVRAAAPTNENLSSSGFIQKLQDTSAQLQKLATAEGGKVLPDGFTFGFDRYLGSKSDMPKPENVKRLALQFTMVEAITREILACHVTALTQVERERFDGESVEAPVASGRRHAAPAAASSPASAVDARYPRQHFTFEFTADERALSEVLGRLAKMPLFVVVTELKIDRLDRGLRPRPEKPAAGSEKIVTTVPPSSQRVVSGPEIAPLLKTQMQVDVYTFEGV